MRQPSGFQTISRMLQQLRQRVTPTRRWPSLQIHRRHSREGQNHRGQPPIQRTMRKTGPWNSKANGPMLKINRWPLKREQRHPPAPPLERTLPGAAGADASHYEAMLSDFQNSRAFTLEGAENFASDNAGRADATANLASDEGDIDGSQGNIDQTADFGGPGSPQRLASLPPASLPRKWGEDRDARKPTSDKTAAAWRPRAPDARQGCARRHGPMTTDFGVAHAADARQGKDHAARWSQTTDFGVAGLRKANSGT